MTCIKKIAIYGIGLIGGSFAAACKRKRLDVEITGISSQKTIDIARKKGILDRGFAREGLPQAVADADLILLAMPINNILSTLESIGALLKPGAIVTDVGSTKQEIVEKARKFLPQNVHFVGGHPMAGSEKGGVENSDPFLFENAIYVLTEASPLPESLLKEFVDIIEKIGAKAIELDAAVHDRIAAVVSHLPQMISVTLMTYVAELNSHNSAYLKLAAGGFRDMTRTASSPFNIWEDIFNTNRENLTSAIDALIGLFEQHRQLIGTSDLGRVFTESAKNRLSIPRDTRGFLRPHYDIAVVVQDRPGMIAEIANTLAKEKINIKDIEVLKIREGDSGNIRLAFESEIDREWALKLLALKGLEAYKRD
jgi:prephenate dehydrogenase